MRLHIGVAAAATGLTLVVGLTVSYAPAGAAISSPNRDTTATTANIIGTGHAVARSVAVSQARQRDRRLGLTSTHAVMQGPLGRDGRLAGATLPVRAGSAARTRPAGQLAVTGPNRGRSAWIRATSSRPRAPRAAWMRHSDAVRPAMADPSDFTGISESGSNCTGCTTPDVTAAVSGNELAETVNLTLQVYSKSTAATDCTVSLASLLGAATSLSHPRIQWDNANNRFSLVADSVPSSAYSVAIQYLATSQTSDACGAWWIYSLSFPISATYPLGANTNFIWVNWAYTDTSNGVPVSAGVAPGEGVPDLAGVDLVLVNGSSTSSISTFGGYSSAEVNPSAQGSCPAGETALTAQEYFTSGGTWTTRLARTTFC